MWSEGVVAYFGGISISQDSRSASRNLRTGTPEYEEEVLTSPDCGSM
jgi:hypothetical protein